MIGERRKGTLKEASIESFVTAQVTSRGLDGRTAKAYHLDLEHLRADPLGGILDGHK